MRTITKVGLSCLLAASLAAPAMAHHSAAAYNTQQPMTITGTVTEYQFRNHRRSKSKSEQPRFWGRAVSQKTPSLSAKL
jgi:hypothetical protein